MCRVLRLSIARRLLLALFLGNVLRQPVKEGILLLDHRFLGPGSSAAQFLIGGVVAAMEISMIGIQCGEHVQQPFNIWLVRVSDVELEGPLQEAEFLLRDLGLSIFNLLQQVRSPSFFSLKLSQHLFDHEAFQRRLRAGPEPHFFVARDVHPALLDLLDVLDGVDGAVEVPHVEAVPHVGLVLLVFRQLRHFCELMCFMKL